MPTICVGIVQCSAFPGNGRNSYTIRVTFQRTISVTFDMAFLFQASSPNYLKSRPFLIPPTAKKTLSGKFEIGEDLWLKIYMLSSKCAIDTRTRVIIQDNNNNNNNNNNIIIIIIQDLKNVLYLNKHLYRTKVVESPFCSLCQKENETFEHLSVDCTFSRKLWIDMKQSSSPH